MMKAIPLFLALCALAQAPRVDCQNSNGDAHASRGIDALNRSQWEEAITEFNAALPKELRRHRRDQIYVYLGDAYENVEDDQQASSAYESALALNAGNCNAHVGLGILARKDDRLGDAEAHYRRALDADENCEEAYSSLGVLAIFRDDGAAAIVWFERALAIDAQFASAHGNYALALAMVGRFPEARAALKRAAALGYGYVDDKASRIQNLEKIQ